MNLDEIFITDYSAKNHKIDIVYTFVNPYDACWQEKYYAYSQNKKPDKIRFDFNEGQIVFSLKTIKKYMSWVNKIFIVSDEQRFLVSDQYLSQKIVFVDHKDIIPKKYLPTFNSRTIEAHLGNIPNLQEYFLYMNDDMFLGNNVDYKDFFDVTNLPIQFYSRCRYYKHPWSQNIKLTNKLFSQYHQNHIDICPQHSPYFIQKSIFLQAKSLFDRFLKRMFQENKIRTYDEYSHNLIYIYAMYSHYKKLSINKKTSFSPLFGLRKETIEKIKKNRKKFYCFFSRVDTIEQRELYKQLQNIVLS
jgi:hypothetical protein